jgi:predicted Zn-dependent peptidase
MIARSTLILVAAAGLAFAQAKPQAKPQAAPAMGASLGLKFPPLREIQLPKIETVTLSNGMQVMLLENHELPTVRGTALVRTGNLFDPADKVGLASITGAVIRSGGTKTKTGDELDEQLENIAASVESQIDESYGTVSFSCLKENTAEVLAAFADVLTGPEFRQDKIDLEKNQIRSGISRRNDDASSIADREFNALLYGKDNSYGWDIQYATLDHIQRADVVRFYQRYYFPANIILAVRGDFNSGEMKAQLEKTFAAWTVTQPKVPPFPEVKKQAVAGAYYAVKADVNQTNFAVGQLGGMLNDKDYPALEVMADILGGGFHSRLFQIVRTQLGNAYSISASWGADYDHPGLFEIAGSTKSATTVPTFKVILEQVEKIRTEPVTAEELETSKSSVLNGFIFNFDTPTKTLNRLLIYKYYGYPDDFLFRYQKAIGEVTAADVLRVAKERLDPKAFALLAVGNPKDFSTPLTELGLPVKQIDITIPEPKNESAADPASIAKGKELLQKVQQALGGADKLAAIHDLTLKNSTQLAAAAGGLKAEQTNFWLAPHHFRQDAKYPFGTVSVYFDGTAGWMATSQGTIPLPPAQREQISGESFRIFVPLLLSDRDPDRKISLVSEDLIEISDSSGNSLHLAIDPKTMLPTREEYQLKQPQGPASNVSIALDDYQPVAGVLLPRKLALSQNGKKSADITVLDAQANTGLKEAVLSRQP